MRDLLLSEYDAVLRSDLSFFTQRCFAELNPQAAFAMNWHIEVIAAKLTAVRDGKIRRLIINLPPRNLKSLMASIAFPAWCLGHDPAAQILCVSYAQDLSDKLARDCRSIMQSRWVPAALSDPSRPAPPGGRRVSDHRPGLSALHLQWWSADWTGSRHDPDR